MAVVQAPEVDADTFAGLPNVLPGERAVYIEPDVILAAADEIRKRGWASHGQADRRRDQRGVRRAVHQLRAHRLPAGDPPGLRRELRGRALPAFMAGHPRPPTPRKTSGSA